MAACKILEHLTQVDSALWAFHPACRIIAQERKAQKREADKYRPSLSLNIELTV